MEHRLGNGPLHHRQLGETEELDEVITGGTADLPKRLGPEILLALAGVTAMAIGSMVLVEGVRRVATTESGQTMLGLTLVGFATGFELVELAWSTPQRAFRGFFQCG